MRTKEAMEAEFMELVKQLDDKALFGADLIYASKGDGATYKARFFGASQVQAIA